MFINAQTDKDTKYMKPYSTLDMFPTTLAAIGVEIDGERLGLGVNLFSQAQPLVAKFGHYMFNTFLAEDCSFYNNRIMLRSNYTGNIDERGVDYIEQQTVLPQNRAYRNNMEQAPTVPQATQPVQQTTQAQTTQVQTYETTQTVQETQEETTMQQTEPVTEPTIQETESVTQSTTQAPVTEPVQTTAQVQVTEATQATTAQTQEVIIPITEPTQASTVVIPDTSNTVNNGNVVLPEGSVDGGQIQLP